MIVLKSYALLFQQLANYGIQSRKLFASMM